MSERIRNVADMFIGTLQFNTANAADYAHLPDGAAKFAIVTDVADRLEDFLTDYASGKVGQAVEQKSVLVLAVRRKMKEFSAAARALNIDDPGFRRLFRITNDNGVQGVVAQGRVFVEEAGKHKTEFGRFGLVQADIDALETDVLALEEAAARKLGAASEKAGAGAGIDDEIDRGMDAEIFLDAMMKVVYRNNAAKLGEWKSARHVRRTSRPAKKDQPETPDSEMPTQ